MASNFSPRAVSAGPGDRGPPWEVAGLRGSHQPMREVDTETGAAGLPDLGPSPLGRVQPRHEGIGTKRAIHTDTRTTFYRAESPILSRGTTPEPNTERKGHKGGIKRVNRWRQIQFEACISAIMLSAEQDNTFSHQPTFTETPFHRKMAFEQRAIFPHANGLASLLQPPNTTCQATSDVSSAVH
ncbi:hypothetical protein PAMA_009981 [Pampus argenteus]